MRLRGVGCFLVSISLLLVPSILVFSVLFHSGVPLFEVGALVVFPIWLILFTRFWMRRLRVPPDWDSSYNGVEGQTNGGPHVPF